MTKLHDFPYHVNRCWSYKVGWPLKMISRIDLLRVFCDMYAPQANGNNQKSGFFCFFGPYLVKFQKFPYHKNYISY